MVSAVTRDAIVAALAIPRSRLDHVAHVRHCCMSLTARPAAAEVGAAAAADAFFCMRFSFLLSFFSSALSSSDKSIEEPSAAKSTEPAALEATSTEEDEDAEEDGCTMSATRATTAGSDGDRFASASTSSSS